MNVCENIRKIRKQKGLTLKQLANKIGVSEQAISHYERGDRKLKTEMLIKIATALDVTTSELMDETTLNYEINKDYYKNITNNDIINLLTPIGLIKDNFKSLSKKEKDNFIENLSNINPMHLKVNNYLKNFDNFTKEDLIEVCNEVQNYSGMLAYNMLSSMCDNVVADYNTLVTEYNKLLEFSNTQKKYINSLKETNSQYKELLNSSKSILDKFNSL